MADTNQKESDDELDPGKRCDVRKKGRADRRRGAECQKRDDRSADGGFPTVCQYDG